MKLAIVISQFPCTDEVFILRELRALQDRGFALTIYSLKTPSEASLHAEAARLADSTRYSPFIFSAQVWRRNLRLALTQPRLYFGLLWTVLSQVWRSPPFLLRSLALFPKAVRWGMELRDHPVARVHAQWATHPSTAGWIMSRIAGAPYSLTAHAHDIYLDQSMLAFKLREATAVLTCTHQNLDFLRSLAPELPPERIRLSYHGLDLRAYRPASAPPEQFRILSVGTLFPRKGFDTLVEACALLEREGIDFTCDIAGDGPMRASLEARARELRLRKVNFLGKQSQENLPEIYRRSSVFVLAAVYGERAAPGELRLRHATVHFGIPNVILEAMASGLTVVTTRMPAVAEIVRDGENAIYVPEGDPQELAATLRALAADPARCKRLGAEAADRIRARFDIQVTSGEVAAVLAA